MKRVLMPLVLASLIITATLSLNSCNKNKVESDEEVYVDEVTITDRSELVCPICGYVCVDGAPMHEHEYFQPDVCPLGEFNEFTGSGCYWFHKVHHIHRYQILNNGNTLYWENTHLGGGTVTP